MVYDRYLMSRYTTVVRDIHKILIANKIIKSAVTKQYRNFLKKYPMKNNSGYHLSSNTDLYINDILAFVETIDEIKPTLIKIKTHNFNSSLPKRLQELGQIANELWLSLNTSFNKNEKGYDKFSIYDLPKDDLNIIEKKVYEELANHLLHLRDLIDIGSYLEKYSKDINIKSTKIKVKTTLHRKRLSNKDLFEDFEPPQKAKVKYTYKDFKVYSDSSIKYKNKNINLPLQKLKLLDLFLSKHDRPISKETIIKYLSDDNKIDAKQSSYVKYISVIKKSLFKITGKNWIFYKYPTWTFKL